MEVKKDLPDEYVKTALMIIKSTDLYEKLKFDPLPYCRKEICLVGLALKIISQNIEDLNSIAELSQLIAIYIKNCMKERLIKKTFIDALYVILIHFHFHTSSLNCTNFQQKTGNECSYLCWMHNSFQIGVNLIFRCDCENTNEQVFNMNHLCEDFDIKWIVSGFKYQELQRNSSLPYPIQKSIVEISLLEDSKQKIGNYLQTKYKSQTLNCSSKKCNKSQNTYKSQLIPPKSMFIINLSNSSGYLNLTETLLVVYSIPFIIDFSEIFTESPCEKLYLKSIIMNSGPTCTAIDSLSVSKNLVDFFHNSIIKGLSPTCLIYSYEKKFDDAGFDYEQFQKLLRLSTQIDWVKAQQRTQNTSEIYWKVNKSASENLKKVKDRLSSNYTWKCKCQNLFTSSKLFCVKCLYSSDGKKGFFCCGSYVFNGSSCSICKKYYGNIGFSKFEHEKRSSPKSYFNKSNLNESDPLGVTNSLSLQRHDQNKTIATKNKNLVCKICNNKLISFYCITCGEYFNFLTKQCRKCRNELSENIICSSCKKT